MKVKLEVSARHIHISQEHLEVLFGKGYALKKHVKPLSQPGQYAEEETVQVVGPKRSFDKVRILGPVREKTQVELAVSDCYYIGVEPVLKVSGDLEGSSGCKLVGPEGEIDLIEGVIVAKRHLHLNPAQAKENGLEDGDYIKVRVSGERALIFDQIRVRVHENFDSAVHLDTDEANAALVKTGDEGEIAQ